jgi:hypothetical protein
MEVQILKKLGSTLEVMVDGVKMVSKTPSHSSRSVYKFKDFVIKVSGSNQNKNEINFYNKVLKAEDAQYFPKLLAHGKFGRETFLVQEKVQERGTAKKKHVDKFNELRRKYGLSDIWISDGRKPLNAAIFKGELKVYDIGFRDGQW